MGMDLVEVSLDIEDRFGIFLYEDEWAAIWQNNDIRVGDLFTLIVYNVERINVAKNDIVEVQSFWSEIRSGINRATGIESDRILLSTPLAELFPVESIAQQWEILQVSIRYTLPRLRYPGALPFVGALLMIGGLILQQIQLWQLPILLNVFPVLIALGIWMLVETWLKVLRFLSRYRTRFPDGVQTVKDLCKRIQHVNPRLMAPQSHADSVPIDTPVSIESSPEVWSQLVKILVGVLGIQPSEISLDSLLIKDFRAG